jgi:taurine dioxygenase
MSAVVLDLERVTSAVGALVRGVDLRAPLEPPTVDALRQAVAERGVLFFEGQDLSDEQMHAFAAKFGRPVPDPAVGYDDRPAVGTGDQAVGRMGTSVWHFDTAFVPNPPSLTALRAVKLPPLGGDTCWANAQVAYDLLSAPVRRLLDGLTALHSTVPTAARLTARPKDAEPLHSREAVHPVVRVHPETRRKTLYVNQATTVRIVELSLAESDALLGVLFEHMKSPELMTRWRWKPDDVAFWDNRTVQHFAVPDYEGPRLMQRVVLEGDVPYGPTLGGGEPALAELRQS